MAAKRTVTFSTVPEVRTVEDLFAIATAMEREAANRYAELAVRMERLGNGPLAALFRRLEKEESGHEGGLGEWANRRGIIPSPPFHFEWDMPETLTEREFAEAGGDFLATPWRVLVMAAQNEERAFAFYANIAAKASDAEVRTYAEAMAREELDHVALLRLERRRAWRREHPAKAPDDRAADLPADLGSFERRVCDSGRAMVGRWRSLVRKAETAGDAETAALLRRLVREETARHPETLPPDAPDGAPAVVPLPDLLREEARRIEEFYEVMMAVAEKARDQAVVEKAQAEARERLSQLARLGDRLAALAPAASVTPPPKP